MLERSVFRGGLVCSQPFWLNFGVAELPVQRSRCTMMFGFAPVAGSGAPVDAEMASSAGSVDSGEASLDTWAEQNLDYPCRL